MGSELLGEPTSHLFEGVGDEQENTSAPSFEEIIYDAMPYYMQMGMSADEFLNCDPVLYRVYRKKQQIELEVENQKAWLNGMYVYDAIQRLAPRLNSIKPKKPEPYPDKPYDLNLNREEKDEEAERVTKQEQGYLSMLAWAERVNKAKESQDERNSEN